MIQGAKELIEDYYNLPVEKIRQIKGKKQVSQGVITVIEKYFINGKLENPEDQKPFKDNNLQMRNGGNWNSETGFEVFAGIN